MRLAYYTRVARFEINMSKKGHINRKKPESIRKKQIQDNKAK